MTEERLQEMRDAAFERLDSWEGRKFAIANRPDRFITWASGIVADAITEELDCSDDDEMEWFDNLVEEANKGTGKGILSFRHDRCPFIVDICKAYHTDRAKRR